MILSFTSRFILSTSQEALLSRDVYYYSLCFRTGINRACLALRRREPTFNLYQYLTQFDLTSKQVDAVKSEIDQTIENARANLIYRKKQLTSAINKREKALAVKRKAIIKKSTPSKSNTKARTYLKSKEGLRAVQWVKAKGQALELMKAKLAEVNRRLDAQDYSIVIGGASLLRKRTTSEGVRSNFNLSKWRESWSEAREYARYAVGSKDKPHGNAEIQVNPETNTVRIRLTDSLANERLAQLPPKSPKLPAKFIEVGVKPFEYLIKESNRLGVCVNELLKDKPISARIYRKEGVFYIAITVDIDYETLVPKENTSVANTLGIDFNANGLAWAVVKPDGNLLSRAKGFIALDSFDEHTLSNALTTLLADVNRLGVSKVAIENLDFFEKKAHMRSGALASNKRSNRMLSTLAYACYAELLESKCAKAGLTLSLINPCYSSVAGFAKYAYKHNTSADIGAAIMIARQALFGSTYYKKLDLPHVMRHRLHKERVSVLRPNQLTNQRKSQGLGVPEELSSWRKISSTLGRRHEWRCRLNAAIHSMEVSCLTAITGTGILAIS